MGAPETTGLGRFARGYGWINALDAVRIDGYNFRHTVEMDRVERQNVPNTDLVHERNEAHIVTSRPDNTLAKAQAVPCFEEAWRLD